MIYKHPPLNRDYHRGPSIKALKRRGVVNHGSTLGLLAFRDSGFWEVLGVSRKTLNPKTRGRHDMWLHCVIEDPSFRALGWDCLEFRV